MNKLQATLAFVFFGFSQLQAGDSNFRIRGIKELKTEYTIQVGNAWLKCDRKIQATLRVAANTPASSLFVRAYFYDGDNKLLESFKAPCPVWMTVKGTTSAVGLPTTLEKETDIEVYFPVTDELENKKWKSVVIVFGSGQEAVVQSRPESALPNVSYPEKAFAKLD